MFDLNYAKMVLQAEAAGVAALTGLVDQPSFEKACRMMLECSGSVITSGVGKAGMIGNKISGTLASTGTPSHFLHPTEAVHGDLGRVQSNDIVLALSHSGRSDEILRLIEPLKQRDIKLICIVGDAESRLAKHSDIALCMGKLTEACPLGLAPSVSTTCMLALGDALALTVMKARQFSAEDYARFHPAGALGAKLITVEQAMLFKSGESLPIARHAQTVQQMLDITSQQKRHGAVMVTGNDEKLIGIITDGDLRRAMTRFGKDVFGKHAEDIMTAGCKRVGKDTLAAEAMAIFHKYRIDELPVVDAQDRPVGLIDVQDIVAIKIVG
jgi:arabinose-5-phosphate isomerase